MLARDFVLETFRQYGVEYLFGNPGTTELPLIDGLVNYPDIEFKVALHEDICVGMAAGYAHVTGKPGVVNLHATPGVAHGLGNIYDAYRAGVPLVVTAGQQDSRLAVEEPALAGDMVSMARSCTKWSWEIKTAAELPVVLHRAFKVAMTEPMGPVLISFPSDIMWHELDAYPIPLTIIAKGIRGDQEAIKEAAELVCKASNPVIISGDRIGRSGAVNTLVELSELIGAKVYVEFQASELNFPYTHNHFAGRFLPNGPFVANALAEADVVIFAGVLSQAPLLYYDNPLVKEGTKVIFIDYSDWEIGKNMHVHVPIMGSPKIILKEITEIIQNEANIRDKEKFEKNKELLLQKKKVRDSELLTELESNFDQSPISPARVMHELNKCLPDNALIVDESVTTNKYVHNYLQLNRPGSLIALKGGGLGYGITASLGAQLGRPNDRVVNIVGDGSSLYYIQALWNAAKFNLPIVYIIVNNTSYMILKGGILNIDGESAKKNVFIGMDLDQPSIDFVSLAKGFGIDAVRVEKPEDLQTTFENAFKEKRPILIDIMIDRTVKVFLK